LAFGSTGIGSGSELFLHEAAKITTARIKVLNFNDFILFFFIYLKIACVG
jgi:hypothetical protein